MKKAILIFSILLTSGISQSVKLPVYTKPFVDSVYICVSPTGHKYHRDRDCRGLARCTHEIKKVSKSEAIKSGYSACKICY